MNKIFKVLFLFLIIGKICWSQSTNFNVDLFQYISPVPGSGLHNPQTNIIIRHGESLNSFNLNDTTLITVTGDKSGLHGGTLYLTLDFKTIIFQPLSPFVNGEQVSVSLESGLTTATGGNVDSLQFYFTITKGFWGEQQSINKITTNKEIINYERKYSENYSSAGSDSSLLSLNDFPTISIKNKNNPENGYYFFSLNKLNNNFLTIINNNGIPIFIKKFSERTYDFTLQKNGMLTYWDDTHLKFYGLDSLYQVVDSFFCGNGYYTDWHELQVMPNGNSFVLSYDLQPVNMDTVITGGDTSANVTGCVIQEIDTEKRVLWQWRSWDHLNITDTDASVDLTQPSISYCHINSLEVVDEDNIIFSIRNFNEITGIERKTGKIKWRFGGKKNQFTGNDTKALILQHDARFIGNNKISVYDNGDINRKDSRAVIYQLDTTARTTVLVKEIHRTPSLWARVMGNVQQTINKNIIVGWGNSGGNTFFTTEYDSSGNLTNDLTFTSTNFIYSYRSFKFPWRTRVFTSESDTIIFPNTSIGNQSVKSIKIFNNTSASREITGYYNNAGEFTITNNFPLVIPPNSNISLDFKFNAIDSQEKSDTLYLVSKSADEMVALPVILIGNITVTDIENENLIIPVEYKLGQNYPNPFNPSTIINYNIPVESIVKIKIYNLLGEEIDELVNGLINPGNHSVQWKAYGLASGIYFYKMTAIDITGKRRYQLAKKMLLLK